MNVNFRQLEAFVQVARLGGFSRAAAQLHLTQSGLSILIRKLEEALDVRLFERTTRQVTLTAAGELMLPMADRLLADMQTLIATGNEIGAQHAGHISLGLPPRFAASLLPGILRAFQDRFPRVSVKFLECINEDLISKIYNREIDFGFGFGIEPNQELDCRVLGQDALVAICAPEHPLARKRTVNWSDLAGHRIITLQPGSLARTLIEQQFARFGEILVPVYEVNSLVAIELARQGLGVAVVSAAVTAIMRSKDLVQHVLQDPVITRPLLVVTRRVSVLSDPALALIDLFEEAANRR
jgi:DNA-binding transcriptional LysR family regulator